MGDAKRYLLKCPVFIIERRKIVAERSGITEVDRGARFHVKKRLQFEDNIYMNLS